MTTRRDPLTLPRSLAALVLALLTLVPVHASAQGTPQPVPDLAIQDEDGHVVDAFHLALEPGERASLLVRFAVAASDPVAVEAYLSAVTSPPNGGFALAPADASPPEPLAWLTFAPESFTLDPGTLEGREVTVAVPASAVPGQYVAALALQVRDPLPLPGVEGVGQIARVVAAITITVPGDVEATFELGAPTLVQQERGGIIQVPLENTGTVPLHPTGDLVLADGDGQEVATAPVRMGTVFAGVATVVEAPLLALPPAGDYRLSLRLEDPDSRATATLVDAPLAVPEAPDATPATTSAPVTVQRVVIEPDGVPLTAVEVTVEIANVGSPVPQATVVLEASRNGQLMDDAVIAEGVTLADGVTVVTTTYAPEEGFRSGLWSFRVRIETVDESGEPVLVTRTGTVRKIDVP